MMLNKFSIVSALKKRALNALDDPNMITNNDVQKFFAGIGASLMMGLAVTRVSNNCLELTGQKISPQSNSGILLKFLSEIGAPAGIALGPIIGSIYSRNPVLMTGIAISNVVGAYQIYREEKKNPSKKL
jgi:hypothetical protein